MAEAAWAVGSEPGDLASRILTRPGLGQGKVHEFHAYTVKNVYTPQK